MPFLSRLAPALRQAFLDVLAVLIPPVCCVCREVQSRPGERGVCAACWAEVEYLSGPACPRCGRPHPDLEDDEFDGMVCGGCLRREPPFEIGLSMGRYRGSLKSMLLLLKFSDRPDLAGPLAERAHILLRRKARQIGPIDRIVPVPLPLPRRLRRGYNQAAVIARELARRMEVPILPRALSRHGLGRPQAKLPSGPRQANVRGAFRLRQPTRVAKRSILLVDDIWTTGATLAECSRVLRRGGASRVVAFSLARALDDFDLGAPGGLD